MHYNCGVAWEVEVTDEFKTWWDGLAEAERISVERAVLLLEERGPHLPFSIQQQSKLLAPFRYA